MVHGYHVILPMYGFWLPNDPRGSWSETIRKWELLRFGATTKSSERRSLDELTPKEKLAREIARKNLAYDPVSLTGQQALAVGQGFADQVNKSGYRIWACVILPEHTHLVVARHSYKIEQVANLLKGSATRSCVECNCHPLAKFSELGKRPPRMWAEHLWKVYLDSEEAIDNAMCYVEENPVKENKPRQSWSFVKSFTGLPAGWITYH